MLNVMIELIIAANIVAAPINNVTFNNPLIETETAVVQPIEEIKELTIQEKIDSNYYECDESIEYIRADDATCLAKPVSNPTPTQSTVKTAVKSTTGNAPAGWYPAYQCTWHVWTKRAVGQWNNATDWYWQAQRDGYATGSTPRVGAIGWQYGHVVYIEAVDGDMVYISERNYDNAGSYRETWKPASEYKYIY